MATAMRTELMDEIYDQFLICKICYELYKRPKTLQCLHTFCTECLEKHHDAELERSYRYLLYTRAISCPICRKKTELPSGGVRRLPENFLVANLGAVLTRRMPETKLTLCEICKPEVPASQKQASSRCLDCSKLLCGRCVELHKKTKVTQQHSLFDIEIEKDIECKVHEGEVVRFYCEMCEMCICVVCTFQEHKGHEVSSFAEGMQKHQSSLDNLVDICKERIDLVKEQLDIIYKCESEIKNAEESIRDMALDTIGEIRNKEQASVQTVYDAYGEDTLDFIKEKDELQEDLDKLQTTCNLTDIMVKDKGMELLLLKKEIQGKLQNLLQRQVRQPPENAMKQVKFIPGNCVFGYLSVKQANGEAPPVEAIMDEQGRELAIQNGIDMLKAIDEQQMAYGRNILKHADSQTEVQPPDDQFTTVGKLLKDICDQRTQTQPVQSEDRASSPVQELWAVLDKHHSPMHSSYSSSPGSSAGTSPRIRSRSSSTGVRERTSSLTPTLRRKVYTESGRAYEERNTRLFSGHNSLRPDSLDLDEVDESAIAATTVYLSTTATCTDSIAKCNKSTGMPLMMTRDKLCGTSRICQTNRETMTKYIATLDMGVTASIPGEDKACGTRAIVTMHASSGESDVRTQDQISETPWKEEYVKTDETGTMPDLVMVDKDMKTDPLSIHDKDTHTCWFNMVTKETETVSPEYVDSYVTAIPQMKSRGLNTLPLPMSDKALCIQTEFLPYKPQTSSCLSQTQITIGTDGQYSSLLATTTSAVSCQTSPQLPSTPSLTTTGSDACAPMMINKQFGSQSVLYLEQSIATSNPDLCSHATHVSPCVSEVATGMDAMETMDQSTDYSHPQSASVSTSTLTLNVLDGSTETEVTKICDMATMTQIQVFQSQETSTDVMEDEVEEPSQLPPEISTFQDSVSGTVHESVKAAELISPQRKVESCDQQTGMDINYSNQSTHTSVATAEVGVLKRPHAMSRGVNTKRTKLMETSTLTHGPTVSDQCAMTNVSHGTRDIFYDSKETETLRTIHKDMCVETPHIQTNDTSTAMFQVLHIDRMSSPVLFKTMTTDRGCSPIDFTDIVDRACSPIAVPASDKSVYVHPAVCDSFTSMLCVKMQDSGTSYDRPQYVDKQNSPVRNLISTRTKFTSTPHVTQVNRAGSPIPTHTSSTATNTTVHQYMDREASPFSIPVTDQGVMAMTDMVTKETGTPHIEYSEQGTAMPVVRFMNSATEMPMVSYAAKETSTVHVHMMHKNTATENIQTREQSTSMAPGVAASYMDLVHPPSAMTVTRGTCTPAVVMQTKETSPVPCHSTDRASSPVKRLTADKAITANKTVMLDTHDTFQSVGKQGRRSVSTSPRPKLASIKEDEISSHSSDEDGSTSSKDTLPDIPPLVSGAQQMPRLRRMKPFSPFSEGRPQMGLGFGNMSHKERFWSSSPTLGSSQRTSSGAIGTGMINLEVRKLPPIKQLRTEISTNTSGIPTETRSTSTTDIQKMDKAVCTESMTMQGKIGECISKLKNVRQRLEQQPSHTLPIYSQASSPTSTVSDPTPAVVATPPLLAAKSRSVDSKLDDSDYSPFVSPKLRRRPTMSFSSASASASDSHSESSDQEQRAKDKSDKARRMRLNINQLLKSASLPESPDPPSRDPPPAPQNSPQVRPKLVIPQILPKMPDSPASKQAHPSRPSSAKDRFNETHPATRERPKSATERSKERTSAVERVKRSATARSVSRERLPRQDAVRDQAKVKPRSVNVEVKPPSALKERPTATPSPKQGRKAKTRPTARFDEVHPLLPSSPRNTRRLYKGIDSVRSRMNETPKQRRERLEKEMTFEDRRALTKQYFQETCPSPPSSRRSQARRSPRPVTSEKPPRGPTSSER